MRISAPLGEFKWGPPLPPARLLRYAPSKGGAYFLLIMLQGLLTT
jgi:hypothetical protein